jgi:cellobiose dehydrogenase (acceptor)
MENGSMATYLVTANERSNFKMWLNTSVERIDRIDAHAVSLNVILPDNGGHLGTFITGRVIFAAGAFGTPQLLFRSGIGLTDQLEVVQSSTEGATRINSAQWIITPVSYNLDDYLNASHPNVFYHNWAGT